MSDVPGIYEALAAVMADVQAVAKRDRNQHANYNFRGIDAVMNAVGPALRTHGVIVFPQVHDVTYENVTTSTGKASTACRVRVNYLFCAQDGSRIEASVAGEAWDHGDKACPKAMSVAFRTALLQALCLPTDEPDPDTHTYERAAVDLSDLERVIAEAQALGLEGDYDGTREYAAQSQGHADTAAGKLRKAIAKKRAEQDDEADTGTGTDEADPAPSAPSGADDGGSEVDNAPDTPAWRELAEAEGVSPEQVLIALQASWPKNDDAARPGRTKDLDAAAERHPEVVANAIERLAQEKRKATA